MYFHPNEQYFPCSIEYLLQNSTLLDNNNPGWTHSGPTQQDLANYKSDNFYVSIAESQFTGTPTAPMYYAVQQYSDVIEISYLMLYAYQGGQTCRALRAGSHFSCIVKTLGIHQGDLERVVVTLRPLSGGGYEVVRVGYEAHGDVTWYSPHLVPWQDGTHPKVSVALNGHSCHIFEDNEIFEFEVTDIVAIVSATSTTGRAWTPYTNSEFKQLGLDSSGTPINDQVWAAFTGRLGISQGNSLDSATYYDGSNLSALDWDYVCIVCFTAKILGMLPSSVTHGDGPSGPGGRSWVTNPSGPLFKPYQLITLNANNDMGEGPGALAWLVGDFNGDGKAEIAQPWANGSSLGLLLYGLDNVDCPTRLFHSDDMGQGPGAEAWLVGKFCGDGKDEIVQCWGNGSSLGMIVYGSDGGQGMKALWGTDDMGQGPGAVTWLVGDVNGDGKDEVIQGWDHDSSLGMIVYGSDGGQGMKALWGNDDMGQGSGAVAWLVGDVNGDGKDEIIQCWANGSSLGMIVYGSDGGQGMKALWGTDDMGEGPGAVTWQVGDINGDGKDEIVQCWANGSSLGMIVYGSDGGQGMKALWGTE
ncbi:MAG: VCBS repeat-containing protein [Magnetospirillum sp.]|nr:VCBS repeat-containing protein [Magnetospirillum sp.]